MVMFEVFYFYLSNPAFNIGAWGEGSIYQELVEGSCRICKHSLIDRGCDRQASARRDMPGVPNQSWGMEGCDGRSGVGMRHRAPVGSPNTGLLGVLHTSASCTAITAFCNNMADKEIKPTPKQPRPAWWEIQRAKEAVTWRRQAEPRSNALGGINTEGLTISRFSEQETCQISVCQSRTHTLSELGK